MANEYDDDWDDNKPLRCPPCSTGYLPGTPEKIHVMRMRVAMGFSPFHPKDAQPNYDDVSCSEEVAFNRKISDSMAELTRSVLMGRRARLVRYRAGRMAEGVE